MRAGNAASGMDSSEEPVAAQGRFEPNMAW